MSSEPMNLSDSRYSRQVLFSPIGAEGQQKLLASKVAIVGMGALGTVLANHMVRAGVGYVRLIDRDFVEASNLQRQMLYDESDALGFKPKAAAAADRLRAVNSDVELDPRIVDLNHTNAVELLADMDLVLDGTDNFAVRFLINDVCVKNGLPWVYGGAVSSRGVAMVVLPQDTPCLRCIFGQAPEQGSAETCDTAGVIGPIIHVVASYQAAEALKLLVGARDKINRSMLHFDLWHNHMGSVDVSGGRRLDCPCCGLGRYDYLSAELEGETIQALCGRQSVQIQPLQPLQLSLEQWELTLSKLGRVERNPFLLKFYPGGEITLVLFPDGRALIQGTDDPSIAKTIYSRYIGM